MNMEEATYLEIRYKGGKTAIMEWDEYDHFIGVLENTPLDEHEIIEIVEILQHAGSGLPIESQKRSWSKPCVKIWWSRKQIEGKV